MAEKLKTANNARSPEQIVDDVTAALSRLAELDADVERRDAETAAADHTLEAAQLAAEEAQSAFTKAYKELKLAEVEAGDQRIKIGALLIEAKAAVGHGKFGTWIKTHFANRLSQRTAQEYMGLAREVDPQEAIQQRRGKEREKKRERRAKAQDSTDVPRISEQGLDTKEDHKPAAPNLPTDVWAEQADKMVTKQPADDLAAHLDQQQHEAEHGAEPAMAEPPPEPEPASPQIPYFPTPRQLNPPIPLNKPPDAPAPPGPGADPEELKTLLTLLPNDQSIIRQVWSNAVHYTHAALVSDWEDWFKANMSPAADRLAAAKAAVEALEVEELRAFVQWFNDEGVQERFAKPKSRKPFKRNIL